MTKIALFRVKLRKSALLHIIKNYNMARFVFPLGHCISIHRKCKHPF